MTARLCCACIVSVAALEGGRTDKDASQLPRVQVRQGSRRWDHWPVGTCGKPVHTLCPAPCMHRERESEQASERETLQVGRPACFATQCSTSGTGLRRNECVRVCVHACARACIHVFMCSCVNVLMCSCVCVCVCVFVARVLNLKGFEKATQLRIQDGEFARKASLLILTQHSAHLH